MAEPPNGTVTLLFTDIESSTQLLRVLGERYAAVVADHQRLLREAIETHHGYEVDSQGDACFAAFARAIDAVDAAAAAQRGLAAHPWPAGVILRVRMGLHTGQPLLTDGRYVGLDVHRAARIAAAAHGGQVLLSQATAELVRESLGERLALRSLGEHAVRDFDLPEHLYQLLFEDLPYEFPPLRTGEPRTEDLAVGATAGAIRFVDRERESETVRSKLAEALKGHGGVLLLAGGPGIGKTRLAEELGAEAEQRGVAVLWGRCWESEGAPPFWPWIQILRRLAQSHPPLVLRAELGRGGALIAELLPELRERLPDLLPTPAMAPEEARFQLFDAVTTFLTKVAQSQPLLLLLDDLHWADKPSLLLLHFLLQRLGDTRVLVLGTYRDVEPDLRHPLTEVLPSLRRERAFERVAIGGLPDDAIGDLITSVLEQPLSERSQNLARVLAAETEGNPFFVQEQLRYLVENERLVQREGVWISDVTDATELGLPEAVREVIARRLSRLSEAGSGLLTRAAVVGREFDASTLQRVWGIDDETLDAALEEAEAARVIEAMSRQPGRYRFSHALFRETLYADLPSTRRRRLHRQVGETLEERYGSAPEPHLAELAHHFVQSWRSGDDVKATNYAQRAGERALAAYAYEEAVRLFETALRIVEQDASGGETRRCDLLLALADALSPTGGARRVVDEVAPAALEIAERLGDKGRAFEACRIALEALVRLGIAAATVTEEFREWLRRADQYAEPGSSGRLWVDIRLQFVQGYLGYPGRTWEGRLQNVERARSRSDERLLCLALNSLLATGTPQQWAHQVDVAREYAEHRWDGVTAQERAVLGVYCAYKLLDGGHRQEWDALHDQIHRMGERTRDPFVLSWTFYQEHQRLQMDGRLDEDIALQERMLAETRGAGMQLFGLSSAARIGARARLLLGCASENLTLLDHLSSASGLRYNPRDSGVVLCQAHLGRRDEVREVLDWLITADGAITDRDIVAVVQFLEAAVLVEHREAAILLAETLAPAAGAATCRVALTPAARHLAAVAALLGERDRAFAYAQQALDVSTRIGNRPEIALARLQLAELLAGELDGRAVAREHLRFATAEFSEMKMQPSIARAARLQERLLPRMNSPTEDSSR